MQELLTLMLMLDISFVSLAGQEIGLRAGDYSLPDGLLSGAPLLFFLLARDALNFEDGLGEGLCKLQLLFYFFCWFISF